MGVFEQVAEAQARHEAAMAAKWNRCPECMYRVRKGTEIGPHFDVTRGAVTPKMVEEMEASTKEGSMFGTIVRTVPKQHMWRICPGGPQPPQAAPPMSVGQHLARTLREEGAPINPERNATKSMLLKRMDEARAMGNVVVVTTQSGSIYRVALNKRTYAIALSKWKGDRWSGWRESRIERPGPMDGINAVDAWITTPIVKWDHKPTTWEPKH